MTDDTEIRRIELTAQEDCPDRKMCFEAVEGQAPAMRPGVTAILFLHNPLGNSEQHDAHITSAARAAEDHDGTSTDEALASTATLDPGGSDEVRFTVPDVDGLYIWCSVPGHEPGGMWLELPVIRA